MEEREQRKKGKWMKKGSEKRRNKENIRTRERGRKGKKVG